jgi:hypothetical protein
MPLQAAGPIGYHRPNLSTKVIALGEIDMYVSTLALIGLAIAGDLSLPADVVEIQTRSIAIPVFVEPAKQHDIESLRLFISQDRGKTWERQAECEPNQKQFTFTAPDDGLYWFAIQIVPKNGTPEPAKVSDLQPAQKVYVNAGQRAIKRDKTYGELSDEVTQLKEAVKRLCSPPPEPDPSLVLACFDVAKHGDFLVLPVTIDGESYKFVVDTGCTRTAFDTSLRKHMGKPAGKFKTKSASGHIVEGETFEPPHATIGDLGLELPSECDSAFQLFGIVRIARKPPQPAPLVDLSDVRKTGHAVRGVIGMDFLRNHVIRIDFDKGKLWFLRSAPEPTEFHVKIDWDNYGLPRLAAQIIGETPKPFLIDTGHVGFDNAGDLEESLFHSLLQTKRATARQEESGYDFLGNEIKTRSAIVKSVEVGIFDHANLRFATRNQSILGLGYWSRYVVTLDFPNSKLYLSPVPRFRSPFGRHVGSGMSLVSDNGRIVAESVRKGGPAALAGVKVGDIITRIANTPVNGVSIFGVYEALDAADKTSLTIQRGKESRTLTLVLAPRGQAKKIVL